jgi:hypothetical protein
MLNIIDENVCETPFYTEIHSKQEFEELVNLNLHPVSVRIIRERFTEQDDIRKAKQIFQTDNWRITDKEVNNLTEKINVCYNEKATVCLSVVYRKYKDKKNLQAIIFPNNVV